MRKILAMLTVILIPCLVAISGFAQETKEAAPEEMSIYGEVKSVDEASNSVKLQYYDYDNDEEKTADIVFDKDTKMENAAALGDIKQGDWIDAVYAAIDGKNLAKSVIVEREEEEKPMEIPEEKAPKSEPAAGPAAQ